MCDEMVQLCNTLPTEDTSPYTMKTEGHRIRIFKNHAKMKVVDFVCRVLVQQSSSSLSQIHKRIHKVAS